MIIHGDCLEALKELPDNSVDSVVTDPPYGLSFMGKKWDYDVPSEEIWREVLRVLKPGGHLLSFCGTRTYHRMVVRIEDAGFEIRDMITWNYGSGFPKSLNVLKAAQKQGIACECENPAPMQRVRQDLSEMEVLGEAHQDSSVQLQVQRGKSRQGVGEVRSPRKQGQDKGKLRQGGPAGLKESSLEGRSDLQAQQGKLHRTEVCPLLSGVSTDGAEGRVHHGASSRDGQAPGSDANQNGSCASQGSQYAKQSNRKPRTVRQQPASQTCGSCGKAIIDPGLGTALKPALEPICVARKPLEKGLTVAQNVQKWSTGAINVDASRIGSEPVRKNTAGGLGYQSVNQILSGTGTTMHDIGRWPANVIFDEDAAAMLDEQSGTLKSGRLGPGHKDSGKKAGSLGAFDCRTINQEFGNDSGGASRFFYCAKASKAERNAGLEFTPESARALDGIRGKSSFPSELKGHWDKVNANHHPTVKPIKLMEYLIRMVTPPNGTVLDPFAGSGTTGVASKRLGFGFIGIEREAEYVEIARRRIGE